MRKIFLVFVLVIALTAISVFFYFRPSTSEAELAKVECIKACKSALQTGQNLSNGPCLSDKIIDNWVCDVAHDPREAVDNLPENQCSAYSKTIFHFVEVDPNCNFIRAI